MTLDFLETVSFWANVAVVLLTLLAATAGLAAWYFSSRLDAMKDESFARFQLESTAKIEQSQTEQEKLRQENLQLSLRLEEERASRLKIEQKLAPRILSDEQQDRIIKKLTPFSGTEFTLNVFNDPEAINFSLSTLRIFRSAGWVLKPHTGVRDLNLGTASVGISLASGMRFHANSPHERTVLAAVAAFIEEGIETRMAIARLDNTQPIHIEVGKKP